MSSVANQLCLFLLSAERLVRCGWDGRSERVEVLNGALEGEVLREVARDAGEGWKPLDVTEPKLYGIRLIAAA